jgi:hypothetical protein
MSGGDTDGGRDGRWKVGVFGLFVVSLAYAADEVGPVEGSRGAVGGVMIGVDSSEMGAPAKSGGLLYFSKSTVPPKSRTRKTWMAVEKVSDWSLVTHRRAEAWLEGFFGGMLAFMACVCEVFAGAAPTWVDVRSAL